MGYGEWVGNESVHWTVVYEADGRETGSVRGRDPISFSEIGAKGGKRGMLAKKSAPVKTLVSKPNFRVQLRFATQEEAERARQSSEIVKVDGVWALQVAVPAVRRKKAQVDPPRPPAEVRIDW
jgi:hypothetical protein